MTEVAQKKQELRRQRKRLLISMGITLALLVLLFSVTAHAAPTVTVDLGSGDATGSQFGVLDALLVVVLLALAPSILIMMTSFTRIIIVLSFLRNAMGTQQSPPNQVLVGLALFLTLFIMWPVFTQINNEAYQPYKAGEITQQQAIELAEVPLKEFMLKQTYTNDLNMFISISNEKTGRDDSLSTDKDKLTDLGLEIVVPSFVTSELKRAFTIGFLLFIPFLIIDMVVSSTLMSMGMVMLPPSMIALPFKIMMFVLVDGWNLLIGSLVRGFR